MKTEIRFISNMVRDLLLLCGNLGMIWPQVFVSNSKCNTSPWVLFCWVRIHPKKEEEEEEYNESGQEDTSDCSMAEVEGREL